MTANCNITRTIGHDRVAPYIGYTTPTIIHHPTPTGHGSQGLKLRLDGRYSALPRLSVQTPNETLDYITVDLAGGYRSQNLFDVFSEAFRMLRYGGQMRLRFIDKDDLNEPARSGKYKLPAKLFMDLVEAGFKKITIRQSVLKVEMNHRDHRLVDIYAIKTK